MRGAIEDLGQLPGTAVHLYRGRDYPGHFVDRVFYNLHGGSGGYYSPVTCLKQGGLKASAVAHLLHCFPPAVQEELKRFQAG